MKLSRRSLHLALLVAATSLSARAQVSAEDVGWHVFPVSPLESLEGTPLDVSFLNAGPAKSRISVKGPHFVDERGKRVRFLGSNVTFSGAFPAKEHIPAITRRMAQLGMNVLRFHHMDARDIWLPAQKELDPEKLDRLDWFIYHLRLNGIYTNINLHVSRTYPGLKELNAPRTFRYGKVLDNFYEPYIKLQEKFAQDLLAHVNPYTKLRLADDPAVAFVEINNENTLLNLTPAALTEMPAPHRAALQQQWRAWLGKRYASTAEILEAWNADVIPLGPEMARDASFGKGLDEWHFEGQKTGDADATVVDLDGGRRAAKVTMNVKGDVAWAYQFHQLGITLEEGKVYTFRFRAKAEPARAVSTALRFAEPPWTILGARQTCKLTKDWQEFIVVSAVNGVDPEKQLRMSVNFGDAAGTVWVADVSLRSGKERFEPTGFGDIENVSLPDAFWPDTSWADFRRFLIDTEQDYFKRIKTLLTDRIGVKSLIVDTQASYGGYWGLHREASIGDYIDMHAYWQHPRFPGRPWDGNNWNIPNTSMVAADTRSTFERLTHYRLEGRPFSVSEYNHPAPNDHAVELFPMFAAYGAHQDWDALYQFCYGNREESLRANKLTGYFNLSTHSGQLAFLPIAALAFRQGLIPKARHEAVLTVPLELMDSVLNQGFLGYTQLASSDIVSPQLLYGTRFSTVLTDKGTAVALSASRASPPEAPHIDSDTLFWNPADEKPVFTVNAPAVKMALGEIVGRQMQLGDVTIAVDDWNIGSWACVALAARDGQPIADSAAVLMSIATRVENTNMEWDEKRSTVGRKWGSAPVVAQTVLASVTLPGEKTPRVTPLSPKGERLEPLRTTGKPGAWTVKTSADRPSLWYVIER